MTESDVKRSKIIRLKIGQHNDEIAHLRRHVLFVETTSEEGVRMTLEQLRKRANRIKASASYFDSKEMKKEYMSNAGMRTLRKQIAELEFLLQ